MVKYFKNPKPKVGGAALFATGAAIATSVGGSAWEFFPHTYLLEKYKSIVQMYRLGNEFPLPEKIQSLWSNVMDDLKIDEKKRKLLKPFLVVGLDLFHAGMDQSNRGSIIGIPLTYSFADKYAFDTSVLKVGNEHFNEHHPKAADFVDSLSLSDNAKKFGIAREILMTQKNIPLLYSVLTPALFISTVFSAEYLRIKLKQYHGINRYNFVIFSLQGLFSLAVWLQLKDLINTYFERAVDKELTGIGPNYVQGGKEFYGKLLKRNQALREILGPSGKKTYNKDGNEIFFFRQKTTQLTQRKHFFETYNLEVSANDKNLL